VEASGDECCQPLATLQREYNENKHFKRLLFGTGLLEQLNDMNAKLEEIQKSLDMYLETKRQIFPRFYFLSNDDLLEILGQSKNPEAVSSVAFLLFLRHLSSQQ